MENRIIMIDNAKILQSRINYITADLTTRAELATDRIDIESIKQDARNCGLFDLVPDIEDIWIETQKENLQLDYFDKLGTGLFGLLFIFTISLFFTL